MRNPSLHNSGKGLCRIVLVSLIVLLRGFPCFHDFSHSASHPYTAPFIHLYINSPEHNNYVAIYMNYIVSYRVISPQLALRCRCKKTVPFRMVRGSAATDRQFSYFTADDSNAVYCYKWRKEKWSKKELPPYPYQNPALLIINGELTAVGGEDGYGYTRKLFTLRQRQWVEEYPPMNTARSSTAVVCTCTYDSEYVIVVGSSGGETCSTSVEMLQVSNRRWYKLTALPQPLPYPSATISGNHNFTCDRGW